MPFFVIRGTFHVVGRNQAGHATGFQPDGDSIHFKPDDPTKLDLLEVRNRPYDLSGIGSVNLRFEGIDAPEIHYQGVRQPAPFAENARDFLTGEIGMNPVNYKEGGVIVNPPANDGQRGHILSRELETNGRPVSFAFVGNPGEQDGASVVLKGPRLKKSLNYKLIASGHAYPLFYDSLFSDLRGVLAAAADTARTKKRGLWKRNVRKKFTLRSRADVESAEVLYPKLFRRLSDFFKTNASVAGFAAWLNANHENDEVWTLPEMNRTHLDNVLKIAGDTIQLTRFPSQLVFVSA